jgi:cytochrome P450
VIGVLPDIVRHGSALPVFKDAWRTYGDVVRVPLGPVVFYLLVHPDSVKHILVDNRDNYPRSIHQIRAGSAVMGLNLLTSEGAHWRRQRHIMQGPFAAKAVADHVPAMATAVEGVIDGWDRRLTAGQPELELAAEMVHLALDALGRSILGFDTRSTVDIINQAFLVVVKHGLRHATDAVRLPLWLPTPDNVRLRRARRQLEALIYQTIRTRRAEPDTYAYASDMLSLMLRAQDDWGEGMLEQHLRDELMAFYFAGHETTAVSLCWALHAIAQDPEVERRLHEEVDRLLGDGPLTAEVVERLTYTDMVVHESLRLYPPITMLAKDVLEDDQIAGYRVTRGSLAVFSPYLTHRHPDFWPDPERFDPERFAPGQAERHHRHSWIPFSGGYHSCIGAMFALQEMKIAIACSARRYRLRPIPERPAKLVEKFTLRPFGGLHMRLEPRR